MDKILLIGIRGTYNLGCEAIVRGTVTLLKRIYPKAMIYYASYDYKNDVTRLSDCDVNILNRPTKKRWSVRNIVRKLLSYVSIEYIPPYEKISLIKEFDAVFSIGGDMYTLWSDGSYCKDLIRLGDQCLALGIPYILWGCSVGPFEKNPKALSVFKEHLQHLPLIVAREYATIDYLKTIGIEDNVFFAPDPSFFVAPECGVVAPERKHRIGVNLSPLSTQHLFATLEEGIEQQARALEKLIDENQAEVILLPHVLSPDKSDNDLLYLQRVYKAMDVSYQQKTTLVDTDLSFVALKKQLQRCDVVIAARMHCALNAVNSGVPTVFLSYSEKSKGMACLVYGSSDFVLPLDKINQISPALLTRVMNTFDYNNVKQLREYSFERFKTRI